MRQLMASKQQTVAFAVIVRTTEENILAYAE